MCTMLPRDLANDLEGALGAGTLPAGSQGCRGGSLVMLSAPGRSPRTTCPLCPHKPPEAAPLSCHWL